MGKPDSGLLDVLSEVKTRVQDALGKQSTCKYRCSNAKPANQHMDT